MTPEHEAIARRSRVDLESRYGAIGISALAAALRYGGERKNPAYAPSSPAPATPFAETAS